MLMGLVSGILAWMGSISVSVISFLGYPGLVLMMALESMIFPLPSELVMPFAGFLAAQGTMNFWLVVFFSTLGSLIGSLVSYYMGMYGGNRFVRSFGKYVFLDEEDLEKTEKWFSKRGERTVFYSRLIPVVRHFISIPAGMGRMDLKKFCLYTLAGAAIWNTFLAYLGYVLGANWDSVKHYSEYVSIPVAIILVLGGGFVFFRHIKHKMHKKKMQAQKNKNKK